MAKMGLSQRILAFRISFNEAQWKYDRAEELRSIYLARYGLDSFLTYSRCRREELQGNFEAAINHCTRFLQKHPEDFRTVFNLARYHTIMKDFDTALETWCTAYKIAVQLDKYVFNCERRLAQALADVGKYEPALQVIESALLRKPKSRGALSLRMKYCLALERFQDAKRFANEAKVLLPKWREPDRHLGTACLKLGQHREAANHLERYLNRCEGESAAFEELAQSYEKLNEPSEVEQVCRRGLQLYPESENLWILLAWAHMQDKRFDDAKYALEKAVSIKPDSFEASKLLADVCGDTDH